MADVPGNRSTGASLVLGQDRDGAFELARDSDWYSVRLLEGKVYAVHGEQVAATGGLPGNLAIYDGAGGLLREMPMASAFGSRTAGFEFEAPADGRYFIAAEREGGAAAQRSGYTVGIAMDAARSPADAAPLDVGRPVTAAIDFSDDVDFWRVRVEEGRSYRFTSDVLFEVMSVDGKYLAIPDPDGEITDLDLRASYSGDLVVALADDEVGSYELAVATTSNTRAGSPWGASDGADRLEGYGSDDTMPGRGGNDQIHGRAGDDDVLGQAGNDMLYGESGRDLVDGGAGNDRLSGGPGADRLLGGSGNDRFVFTSAADSAPSTVRRDIIADFAAGDRIDLSALDATPAVGDQAFRFVGGSPARNGGDLGIEAVRDGFLVRGNTDSDQQAEFELMVQGARQPVAADFIL